VRPFQISKFEVGIALTAAVARVQANPLDFLNTEEVLKAVKGL
jgi:hypothetical protein